MSIREPAMQMVEPYRRSIRHFYANVLYGYDLMQKLPQKDLSFTNKPLGKTLSASYDSDYGYWVMFDVKYTKQCKDNESLYHLKQ